MSILTKISVVLLVVLVLLAAPVFITQATVAPNYRELYEQEKVQTRLLAQEAQHKSLALELAQKQREAALQRAQRAEAQKASRVNELEAEIAALETKNAGMQATQDRLLAELKGQRVITKGLTDRTNLLAEQTEQARDKINNLLEENSRLSSLLKDSNAKLERAQRATRVYTEKIAELEQRIEELNMKMADMRSGAVLSADGETQAPDAGDIEGTVLAVSDESGIASINIGSANGIKSGMKLVIYRDGNFVGYLKISEVEARQAAGVIVDEQLAVQPSDKVTTSQALTQGVTQ